MADSKDKINEALEEFGGRYGFVAKLNDDNICALTADGSEKVFVEFIPDSDRVTIYASLFAYSEQTLSLEQLKLVMLMNIELFAKTGGIVALHPLNENPILCWGADADVLPKEAMINVLLNIVELIKLVRDKLDLYESTPNELSQAPAARPNIKGLEDHAPKATPGGLKAAPASPSASSAPKVAANASAGSKAPSSNNLQDMLMQKMKK